MLASGTDLCALYLRDVPYLSLDHRFLRLHRPLDERIVSRRLFHSRNFCISHVNGGLFWTYPVAKDFDEEVPRVTLCAQYCSAVDVDHGALGTESRIPVAGRRFLPLGNYEGRPASVSMALIQALPLMQLPK